ncbi:uncharacterized protein BJ171DRAFT_532530 [Polychytrium aggregatum]|uniref:uncharacterized protein n=1 Tax=Polychytrium aggregatum TaxID=110093 RepID=UPI0022FED39C|nr:uncharacterized protein BJ171DRAFT_532530 [Polychytrium aggregatum]KAI9193135.1 hypothetical protein BJ171DRAFT_532530 [Polychytrium aggregatum]
MEASDPTRRPLFAICAMGWSVADARDGRQALDSADSAIVCQTGPVLTTASNLNGNRSKCMLMPSWRGDRGWWENHCRIQRKRHVCDVHVVDVKRIQVYRCGCAGRASTSAWNRAPLGTAGHSFIP